MDWKAENPKSRYIDSITDEEAHHIAWLASGCPDDFKVLDIERECNGNNIPHVKIKVEYWEPVLCEVYYSRVGIFDDLNTYIAHHFHSAYCQKEIFKYYEQIGLE